MRALGMRALGLWTGLWCGVAMAAGQAAAPAMTVEQIAARLEAANAHRDAALRRYGNRLEMTVTVQGALGAGRATETVDMTYTAPSRKVFHIVAADGPQLLRDTVFQKAMDAEADAATAEAKRQSALTRENYTMRLVGEEQRQGGDCYVLEVVPRTSSPYAYAGRVWVQAADFAVIRIEGKPAQDVSMWVTAGQFTTTFTKTGMFYFPSETTSTSQIRLGGTASLTIRYGATQVLETAAVVNQ